MAIRKSSSKPKLAAVDNAADAPPAAKAPSKADIKAVGRRLSDAGFALLAMRQLALDAVDSAGSARQEGYLVAVVELARSTLKGVDACIVRLTGDSGIGEFRGEFDDSPEDGDNG